jgi:hypothetical protein
MRNVDDGLWHDWPAFVEAAIRPPSGEMRKVNIWESAMTERTPEVEINVDSTEYEDCVVIEIEIIGADEAVRNKLKTAVLQAVAAVTGSEQ